MLCGIRRAPFRIAIAALAIAAAAATTTQADVTVADNFTPTFQFSGYRTDIGYRTPVGGSAPVFDNKAMAQRFIPTQGGPLASITIFIRRWAQFNPPDLHVSIRADHLGKPGDVLGERAFAPALFPDSYFPPNDPITLDLSTLGVPLIAGQPYHAAFRTDTAIVGAMFYSLHVQNPHPGAFGLSAYSSPDGGLTWRDSPLPLDLEIALQVRVVPEPGGMALAVLLTPRLLARRRARPQR